MLSNSIIQWLTPIKKAKLIPYPELHPKNLILLYVRSGMIGVVYHKMLNKAKHFKCGEVLSSGTTASKFATKKKKNVPITGMSTVKAC